MRDERKPMKERVTESKVLDSENDENNHSVSQTSVNPDKKGKEAMFMGLGDVIFPGMLVVSAVQWLPSDGFWVGMITMLGGLIGYMVLMTYVARGKPQAGLPLLNGGAILGYLIGGLLMVGSIALDFGIGW